MTLTDNPQKKRTVRSFVRRAGRMTASQERALEELWPDFGIDEESALDLDEVFGRQADRVLEIGFGNGDSLVLAAAESPDKDFLGIEVHDPGIGHCMIMAREKAVSNLRVISRDAIEVLQTQIAEGALSRINLYFADPWPKKRHHKRRIVQLPFLQLVASRLAPGGTLHIATDWENYAEHIDEMLAAQDQFALETRREHQGDQPLDRFTTKFERRGLRKGHRIWDWRLVLS